MKGLKLEAGGNVSLREAVYQTLRRAILTNLLKPGERLMELKLAAELGVSRTPVREAIHLLEKELLVKQELLLPDNAPLHEPKPFFIGTCF